MPQYTALSGITAITASSTKTLVGISKPADEQIKIKEVAISFDGIDAAKVPVHVQLVNNTTTGTGSALTLVDDFDMGMTPATTALNVFTVEPTLSHILRQWYVTPAGGLWTIQWPLGDEVSIWGGAQNLAIRVITAAGVANNALAHITFVE